MVFSERVSPEQDLLLDQDGIEGERTTEATEKESAQVKPDLGSPTAAVLGDDHEPDAGGEQAEDQQPGIVETKVILQDEEEEGEIAALLDRLVDAIAGKKVWLEFRPIHQFTDLLRAALAFQEQDQEME